MTEIPSEFSANRDHNRDHNPDANATLLTLLRRKEGNWVTWGKACQSLQKSGLTPQAIFESTGFEPIQQNQIIVAAQVYDTILAVGVPPEVQAHFEQKGSDSLYELRILMQAERAAAATWVYQQGLDSEAVHEAVRAMKEFSRLSQPPEHFTSHPGDQVAFQAWKTARQKTDLQERSHLIARGLQFAHSQTARRAIEQLLTDFTVTPSRPVPRLPFYRLDSDEELPYLLPVVGTWPLTRTELQAVPKVDRVGRFQLVQAAAGTTWLPIPGWQVIRSAADPVAILAESGQLPDAEGPSEPVVIVIDREQTEGSDDRYFLVDAAEGLQLRWLDEPPTAKILGQVILIFRPKKVLDEDYTNELWQIDE